MQILILSGSRNREGRTALAISAMCKGVVKAGGNAECLFLPELAIERCRQCESDGWGLCRREGRCINDDDFPSIVEKIKSSDVIVFATPVYFGDLSESMRAFLGRLRRICRGRTESQHTQDVPVVGLCLAGGGGGGSSSCCVSLEGYLRRCGFDIVDMVPLRRQNLDTKLPILELIGEWLVTKPASNR